MLRSKPVFVALAATALAIGGLVSVTVPGARADTTLCQFEAAPAAAGAYTVENDEWNSSADECITADGGAEFTVANSAIANGSAGAPGGYPSIFAGCHWGRCTTGGLAAHPLRLASIGAEQVTSSWDTSQAAAGSDIWDAAYDIWINQTPTTAPTRGVPNGTEVMVWLDHQGAVQPAGSLAARNVQVGAYHYDVWYRPGSGGGADTVTYTMRTPRTAVARLDIGAVLSNAKRRGYTKPSWYLISVEAGFEIWAGGSGLATRHFSVDIMKNAPFSPRR